MVSSSKLLGIVHFSGLAHHVHPLVRDNEMLITGREWRRKRPRLGRVRKKKPDPFERAAHNCAIHGESEAYGTANNRESKRRTTPARRLQDDKKSVEPVAA